jgi:hypothetical protein
LFSTYAALVWSGNSRMIGLASTVLIPAVFMAVSDSSTTSKNYLLGPDLWFKIL